MIPFALKKTVTEPLEVALERFKLALTAEGFGLLYTLDFSQIIRDKTGQALPGRVVGLGVCAPGLALRALELDPSVAALLPCGAFALEVGEGTTLGFLDPDAALRLTGIEALEPLGRETKARLERALAAA